MEDANGSVECRLFDEIFLSVKVLGLELQRQPGKMLVLVELLFLFRSHARYVGYISRIVIHEDVFLDVLILLILSILLSFLSS